MTLLVILLSAALASDATGVRFEGASPGDALTVPGLAGHPGTLDASTTLSFAGTSAVAHWSDGSEEILLANAVLLDLAVGWSATPGLRVDAGLPIVAAADAADPLGGRTGDAWFALSRTALRTPTLALGPRVRLSAPVAPYSPLTTDGGTTVAASLVAAYQPGEWSVAAEAGVGGRPASALGTSGELAQNAADELYFPLGLSADRPIGGRLRGGAELASTLAGGGVVEGAGAELLARLSVRAGDADVVAGGGVGLGEGLGVPAWRGFVAVRGRILQGEAPTSDADGDGLADAGDQCPRVREDPDGWSDADGCPDPDNDADTVRDLDDRCPNDPEDADGWQDADGCPDLDDDADGTGDGSDACPRVPGPPATRGCPDAPRPRVVVTQTRVEIDERVYFDTGRATIQVVSYPLLEEVAAALNAAPDVLVVQVLGHTDNEGDDAANLALSQARAEAVRTFLVTYGRVDPGRLTATGFGETMPIADNATEDGRAQNRRVEFVILRRR